jgi:tetratricopeptide (TPR) repeat protein
MSDDHPSRRALEDFVLGSLPRSEQRRVSRHLLAGCEECGRATAGLWDRDGSATAEDREPAPPGEDAYDRVLDRVFARVVASGKRAAQERAEADQLFAELARHPPARRELLVCNSSRFRRPLLAQRLIDESQSAGLHDPAEAVALARLAIAVIASLGEASSPCPETVEGLRAKAWSQLGNAWRVSNEHSQAESSFARALEVLAAPGRVGLLDRACVLDQLASLRRDQRRFDEAIELLDRVAAIYGKLGQRSLIARTLSQKAGVYGEAGQVETEIALYQRALEMIDQQAEPWHFLVTRHNLIWALNESGRCREAFALLFHTRPLYLRSGNKPALLRMRWLEGMIALGLSRNEQAEAAFREVRAAFLDLNLDYDAALASLNLAEVYARQGRAADVRALAEEMLAVFAARSIHREALAALSVFADAARRENAQAELVRDVTSFLKRSRNNPALRFGFPE